MWEDITGLKPNGFEDVTALAYGLMGFCAIAMTLVFVVGYRLGKRKKKDED